MADNQDIILKLIEKLENLYKKQADFTTEINSLKEELYRLKTSPSSDTTAKPEVKKAPTPLPTPPVERTVIQKEVIKTPENVVSEVTKPVIEKKPITAPEQLEKQAPQSRIPKSKSSIEKFIGENLLNKVGIIITIIGVAIGGKYSIENELISPLTRIILGYLAAIGLLGFGIKLQKKYNAYSAVLVSGSIVILYFITFFAYSFYELIPQTFAFALMVVFTAFTVVAAIRYNQQIIAHLGLVGAYAVPFLLSNDSGRVEILFGYMAIINIGILIISFKKYWKSLFYSAFIFTWLIFASWYFMEYNTTLHFNIALVFLLLFFVIFYVTFLAYKMVKKEAYGKSDIVLLLTNSFVFYALGYALLSDHPAGKELLGIFTLGNAIIHFIVALIIHKQKLGDKNLFYLASGLVLVFITITIPVQLDGNWVTLLWAGMAALLFWIGRTKAIAVYEKLSYPLMFLAFLSLLQDWADDYGYIYNSSEDISTPLFNITFLSSALFIAAFAFILFVSRKKENPSAFRAGSRWKGFMSYAIPVILVTTLYFAFRLEIAAYFDRLFYNSSVGNGGEIYSYLKNFDYKNFGTIWVINYSLLFVALLSFFNAKTIKNNVLREVAICLTVICIFVFLVQGLYTLSELRESYLTPSDYFNTGVMHLIIRYISYAFLAVALYTCYRYIKQAGQNRIFKTLYDLLFHITILWVLSSELIHWMDLSESAQSYKLGLSILWGVYSFLLIAFGIWKNKIYLRIGGIILFAITLVKLFFYDISHLNTISKTIVFLALGVLLLIISFLYNKYKSRITDDVTN